MRGRLIEALMYSVGVEHPYLALIFEDYAYLLRQSDRIKEVDLYEQRADSIIINYPKKQQTEFYKKNLEYELAMTDYCTQR